MRDYFPADRDAEIKETVAAIVVEGQGGAVVRHPLGTVYGRGLRDLSKAILDVDPEFADPEYQLSDSDLFWRARNLLDSLSSATAPDDEAGNANFWRHHGHPLSEAKAGRTPPLQRQEIESAVGDYLQMPVRSQYVDRLLVDLLVAMELFAFARDAFGHGVEGSFRLLPSAFISFLKGRFVSLLVAGAFVALTAALNEHLPAEWGSGILLIIIVLAAIDTGVALFALPWAMVMRRRHNERIRAMLAAMNRVYLELDAQGPISVRNFVQLAEKATDVDVVWPAPLFALLDDIAARSGRF